MEYKKLKDRVKFSVAKILYAVEGKKYVRRLIVLRDDESRLIIRITDFADYLLFASGEDTYVNATDNSVYSLCAFLNYVFFEQYEKYGITSIYDMTWDMFQDYMNSYCSTRGKSGRYPRKAAVNGARATISLFGEALCVNHKKKMKHLRKGDFIRKKGIMRNHRAITIPEYTIKVRYYENETGYADLERDMPLDIMERFIQMAEIYDPEITFAIVLMAYAGLRVSEVCNVVRKDSCLGPGIAATYTSKGISGDADGLICTSFELNLKNEKVLRGDGVDVGNIKCERIQPCFGRFHTILDRYYRKHLELIKDKPVEETKPMFISKKRKGDIYPAATNDRMYERIKDLFDKRVYPSLENDPDESMQVFYHTMKGRNWGPHSFRHWFTVMLVLCGCDAVQIQTYRGDKNMESANSYLMRKGEFMERYKIAVNTLGNSIKSRKEDDLCDK